MKRVLPVALMFVLALVFVGHAFAQEGGAWSRMEQAGIHEQAVRRHR